MIRLDDRDITLEELLAVADGATVELSEDHRWTAKIAKSRALLEAALHDGRPIYGVSTAVGNRSYEQVEAHEREDFALTIVHQHGCGVGEPYSVREARAITFARLVSLSKGCSAVRPGLLAALRDVLNHGLAPVIPRLGSVGASGDLTPLSYLASLLMGEREACYEGEILPAAEALERAGLAPYPMAMKETLAVMNGTSTMTAVAILSADRFARGLAMAERATALACEVMLAASEAFHPTAHAVKPHPGQVASAAAIAQAVEGSGLMDATRDGRMVQDPYSLRCAPHVLGAARDSLTWIRQVLGRELNSVNDNPIVEPESEAILFAGNFYGGHVALAMDLLKVSVATVADLMDRQFALLLDSRHNLGLPETLVDYGGNGIKGTQITSTALSALIAQRSGSDTVQSRATEVGNQDKVSMGTNAAANASEVVTLFQRLLAAELIALSNAAHVRGEAEISRAGKALLAEIRERSPVLTRDRRLDRDIAALAEMIDGGRAEV